MTVAGAMRGENAQPLSLGLQLGPQTVSWEELRRWTLKAEALGFDSVWLADHFIRHFEHTSCPVVEMWSGLAALAACTTRIRLGSLVASVTHRNPGITAVSAATIDRISGGRFVLGLGAGWSQEEHRAYGIPLPPPATRLAMLAEAIQICRLLWTGDVVSFQGKHFHIEDAACEIKPAQDPLPILVGAMGEQVALRVVAQHADIWNMVGGDLAALARKQALLDRYCEEVGRDPATLRRSIEVPIAVASDEVTLRRRLDRVIEHRGYDPARAAEICIAGTPERCIEQIARYQAMGISEFMLITLAPFDDDELDCFAERVLPAFAARDAAAPEQANG
ncbi:MAG TPA: TIGR03560 family F420-dependent LLM class oxidoreductase [Chloroflexota bacterium]|nr:TIGR03560 family F420-dependent LLM class oxidoreductase [Chloroflexota bacterium]